LGLEFERWLAKGDNKTKSFLTQKLRKRLIVYIGT